MYEVGDKVRITNTTSKYIGCEGRVVDAVRRTNDSRMWYVISLEKHFEQPVLFGTSLMLIPEEKKSDPNLLFRRKKSGFIF